MKHKVKLVKVRGEIITLRVDGVQCSYLIQRPTPLSLSDTNLLRNVMDTGILESLVRSSGLVGPRVSPWARFVELISGAWGTRISGVWENRGRTPFPCELVAEYIKKVGVEFNIDRRTKGVAILKSDVAKIRKGELE